MLTDYGPCPYCGRRMVLDSRADACVTDEHVIPLSRGGFDGPPNVVDACRRCNHEKGNLLPHEWTDRWYLVSSS